MEPEPMPSFPEQALSEHGSFVRRLARKLLADAHLADDVAQEAWSRYFAAPPASANPRGWLARTVRNLATNTLRARSRRAEHEQRGARPEPARCGADEAEQAELLRTLVEAVLALEPTQRDTLLALYFRGVDAKTLARESSVPEPTVRDRQRRALATLRQRLDGKFGDKRAWGAALARLAGPASSVPVPLGLGALAAAAGLVALGSLGVAVWVNAGSESEASAQTASSSESFTESQSSAPEEPEPAIGAASREPSTPEATPPAARSDGEEDHAVESIPQVVLRGRFVTSAGNPIAGVPYELGVGGATTGTGRPIDPPFPEGIDGLGGTSDTDGRFEVSLPPIDSHSVSLSAKPPGYSRVAWDADSKPAGEYDLGDVTLYRGATLTGRVVDAEGRPMIGLVWQVSATVAGDLAENEAYRWFAQTKGDAQTAEFRLEGLLPGLNRLNVRSAGSDQVPFEVRLVEGETVAQDFVYTGADPRRRLAVDPSMQPHLGLALDPEHVHLIGPDGGRYSRSADLSHPWRFVFDDLEPGSYALEIDDPRFQFVRMEGLSTGTAARPRLEGNSAFAVTVFDSAGERVEVEAVEVELRNVNFSPHGFAARLGKELTAGGLIRRCVAGDYVLRVRHAGASGQIEVDGLVPGEIRALTIQLVPGARIAGRVVDENGAPHVGLEVLAVRPAPESDSEASEVLRANMDSSNRELCRKEIRAVRTDDNGDFELTLETAETVLLRAVDAFVTSPLGEALALEAGDERTSLAFTLPRFGSLRGVLRAPEPASPVGMRVLVAPSPDGPFADSSPLVLTLASDGAFVLAGLRPGSYRLSLTTPISRWLRTSGSVIQDDSGSDWCYGGDGQLENGLLLADVEVASGEELQLDFAPGSEVWPGRLELDVLVNGERVTTWGIKLREESSEFWCDLKFGTDSSGQGKRTLFAGRYLVTIEDPLTGWTHAFPDPIVVQASQLTRQVLEVERQ